MAKKARRRVLLCLSCLWIIFAPARGLSQSSSIPAIVVGKDVAKFFKEADNNRLSRALLLNQLLGQTSLPSTFVPSTVVIAPHETVPYGRPLSYNYYSLPSRSYDRPAETSRYQIPMPSLQMRVRIESTDPVWNLALEVNNPNPFSVPLNFLTEQQFDFVLETEASKERIWQWSAGKSIEGEKTTIWLEKGETKKLSATFDPKSVRLPEKLPLLLKGILNSYPTPLSVEAYVIYQEKEK